MKFAGIAALAALALSAQVLAAQQPGPPPGMAEPMRMMDSMNARLDTLVNRMNRATGTQKVTAMADVLNQLVADRKAAQARMRQMMESRHGAMQMGPPDPSGNRPAKPTADSTAADTALGGHHPPK